MQVPACAPPRVPHHGSYPWPLASPLCSNMVFLKRYEGDVAELGLSFTITDNVLGTTREVRAVLGATAASGT